MALTPGQAETLAPKPGTVSSTSSLDTFVSAQHDLGIHPGAQQSVGTQQSLQAPVASGRQSLGTDTFRFNHPGTVPSNATSQSPSPISLVPRGSRLNISPSTGVVVPSSVPSTNTVPEFLYQLTKMLTDHNRDVIEWSNGKIEVHNPHKLQTHVMNRYFRHSKFASFQRQLNYFGFRKLAGKGKMAPCSYVNDATTHAVGSLLLIKRKTGNEPKVKAGKIRDREVRLETQGSAPTSAQETTVNPVLAGILYRSASDHTGALEANRTSTQPAGGNLPQHSQQALARVAVGKGIRHSFTLPKTNSAAVHPQSNSVTTPNPLISESPVQSSLSALQNNFRNSLQDLMASPSSAEQEESDMTTNETSSLNQYIPGSLRRDDSLVDLAMIPMIEDGTTISTNASSGFSFVDFPWQDPSSPSTDVNQT